MPGSSSGEVTRLLGELSKGNSATASQLFPLVYAELRRLAASALRRERQGHTLQPTALVHEAYLRLVDQRDVHWESRAHFLAIAAQAMRRILVDHYRRKHAARRGEGYKFVPLGAIDTPIPAAAVDLEALDTALERLSASDQRLGRIVELRFFGGLTIDETATVLRTSPMTVKREWQLARVWLKREIELS